MSILQLTTEKENSPCFDFLEERIREESKKLIESIYADEVRQFLERMSSVVDKNGKQACSPKRLPQKSNLSDFLRKCRGKSSEN